MKKLFFTLLFLCSALLVAQEKSAVAPQIGIKVPLGDTVILDGLHIQFMEVLEDSRCPSDVQCVWAGQAKVKVLVTRGDKTSDISEIIFGGKSDRRLGTIDGFHIEAIALSPYPESSTVGKLDYALIIKKSAIVED